MKKVSILIMSLGLVVMTACKPASKQGVRVYTGTQRSNVTGAGTTTIPSNCSNGQSAWGTIYGSTTQPNLNFEQQVKLFLSAATDPNEVGTISSGPTDSTGIRFQAALKLDQAGAVVLGQSKIAISVYDSYASSGQAEPIKIIIETAHAGQFNSQTGVGSVTFKDNYGEIILDGRIDGQFFKGTVRFTNYVTVVSGASPASGLLGDFTIATCGMIVQ